MMEDLSLIAKATLILAVALAATRVARRARASVRSLILAAAFGLVLVLPLASAIAPTREVQIPQVYATRFLIADQAVDQRLQHVGAPQRAAAEPTPAPWRLPSAQVLARSAWLLGTGATLLPLVLGLWRLRNIRRRAQGWPEGRELVDAMRQSVGMRRSIVIVVHDDVATPMTCGWVRPTIAMPADAPNWPASDIRQALLHELEHVRRHDWPVHILARVTCSLYWFHPAAWVAWRQLSLESERACDDSALAQTDGTAYAQQLVSLARRCKQSATAPLLSMADRSSLAARVYAVLDATQSRGRAGAAVACVVFGVSAILTAGLMPLQARVDRQGAVAVETTQLPDSTPSALRFPIASVRPNDGSDPSRGFGFTPASGRLRLRNQTLRTIISIAYSQPFGLFFPDERISGGPAWMDRDRFTIEARAERAVSANELGAMLRALLADRFNLRVRLDTRQAPVYALVAARPGGPLGPELRRSETECTAGGRCGIGGGGGRYQMSAASMSLLAASLSELVGRPVVDRTGLAGSFDGTLTWTPTPEELGALGEPAPRAQEFGASLFTALEEQFGLKLQSERGGVQFLIVENASQPTPNDAPELPAPQGAAGGTPSFEVASVRQNKSGAPISRGPMMQPGSRFVAQNVMARVLITTAYGLRHEQVVGGPAWLDSDSWDIEARARDNASLAEVHQMLRALLAERFGLVARRETRQQDLYALVAAGDTRRTPGLRPAATPCAPLRFPTRLPAVAPDSVGAFDSEPTVTLGHTPKCERRFLPGFIGASQITMPEFAEVVTMFARRHVVDRTGLKGEFDIDLTFAPDPGTGATPGDFAPLGTALQEQLGLKLEAERGPVEVLVIDRANRPTAN